jgi:diaminopimelate epimerase
MVKTVVHRDHDHYWIELIGNATVTATITLPETALIDGDLQQAVIAPTSEQAAYERFVAALPHRALADTLTEGV